MFKEYVARRATHIVQVCVYHLRIPIPVTSDQLMCE